MSDTAENLNYLRIRDLQKEVETLRIRHDAMEAFIKDQYPQYFAGEVGTVIDPDLNPVELIVGPVVKSLIEENSDAAR